MPLELLYKISQFPLPATITDVDDIDKLRVLRAAGHICVLAASPHCEKAFCSCPGHHQGRSRSAEPLQRTNELSKKAVQCAARGLFYDGWVGDAYLGLSSVETLVIPSVKAANDTKVNEIVARANVVFIAGGDQSDYIKYWKNTALDKTLRALISNQVPLGGTSAGLAVLGQFDFAALQGSVTSTQALSNPFNKYMTLDPTPQTLDSTDQTPAGGFLTPSLLFNTILDAHLDERDRMGRLVTFVSRLVGPYNGAGCSGGILVPKASQSLSPTPYGDLVARGIGVGVEAALLVSGDGGSTTPIMAQLVTNPTTTSKSAAYFVLPQNYPGQCADTKPLSGVTATVVKVDKLNPTFNLSTWSGGYAPYTFTVTNGVMTVLGNGNSVY